jgi:NDMA-dependent alcohol dehydrogenase
VKELAMKARGAFVFGLNQDWQVLDMEVTGPRAGEVLVEWKAAGMCHSDEHIVTGDLVPPDEYLPLMGMETFFPVLGGHEGAGIVTEVGPGVTSVKPGDHVSASFVPSCGRCRYCSTGKQNLCDNGARTFGKGALSDGVMLHHVNGEAALLMAQLGTFSTMTCVHESSVIKVENDLPLEVVALVSCGVATGFGSSVNRAEVAAGDTVIVVGVGGIGMNAVQGAAISGAKRVIAVDPVEFKREKAMEFGATHTFPSMADAMMSVMDMTQGQMADKVIMTPGVLHGDMMEEAMNLTGKGGTIVVTAISPMMDTGAAVNLFNLAMWNKEIKGTIFGSMNPRADIPKLLGMYRDGQLKLDELITNRYSLDDINVGYQAMRDGTNLRGVIML